MATRTRRRKNICAALDVPDYLFKARLYKTCLRKTRLSITRSWITVILRSVSTTHKANQGDQEQSKHAHLQQNQST